MKKTSLILAMFMLANGFTIAQNVQVINGFTVIGPIIPEHVGPLQPVVDLNHQNEPNVSVVHDKLVYHEPQAPENYVHYPDGALQTTYSVDRTPTINILFNNDGFNYNGSYPPDPNSACGDLHFVTAVNGGVGAQYHVYDKVTGASLSSNLGFPTPLSGGSYGDPVVMYDDMADRWVLVEISDAGTGGNRINVYVSQTNNILTTGWNKYQITVSGNDYPKLGVWPSGYFLTTNDGSQSVYALDRTPMLAGSPTTVIQKTTTALSGFGFQALAAVDFDGNNPPPVNAPCILLRHRDTEAHGPAGHPANDYLEVFEFAPNFASPGSSTWTTTPTQISVSEFSSDLNGFSAFNCFPQPGTSQKLDPLREVIMNRPQYINFGTHQSIVCAHVTDANGADRGGVRWYEIRKPAATWTLYQEGTYAPAGDSYSRWMPAISQDLNQNIAICYSVSASSVVYPGLRMTARSAGDPLGQMTLTETTIATGASSQGIDRWGDYFAMTQDPVTWNTFYFDGMYMPAGGNWRIRNFAFNFSSNTLDMLMYSVNEFTTPQCDDTTRTVDAIIRNAGISTIDSCDITYSLNGAPSTLINYMGPLAPGATDTVQLVLHPIVSGSNTFLIYISNPNGSADQDMSNDTLSYTFNASFGLGGTAVQNQDILCFNQNNGSLTITPSGGLAPFTYSIGGSYGSSNTFTSIGPGTVTAHVKDAAGCVYNIAPSITFTNPPQLTASGSVVNASTGAATDGSITVTASGGTGTLQYNINGGSYQASNVFTNLAPGNYTVGVMDDNGCTTSFIINVGVLGVDENPLQNSLKVYPNPTFGKITIQYVSNYTAQGSSIQLLDATGKMMRTFILGDVIQGQNTELDLTGMAKGVYTLRFYSGKWTSEQKIILQ